MGKAIIHENMFVCYVVFHSFRIQNFRYSDKQPSRGKKTRVSAASSQDEKVDHFSHSDTNTFPNLKIFWVFTCCCFCRTFLIPARIISCCLCCLDGDLHITHHVSGYLVLLSAHTALPAHGKRQTKDCHCLGICNFQGIKQPLETPCRAWQTTVWFLFTSPISGCRVQHHPLGKSCNMMWLRCWGLSFFSPDVLSAGRKRKEEQPDSTWSCSIKLLPQTPNIQCGNMTRLPWIPLVYQFRFSSGWGRR